MKKFSNVSNNTVCALKTLKKMTKIEIKPVYMPDPLIKILIKSEEDLHHSHPVNKCIRLLNQFAFEGFIKF